MNLKCAIGIHDWAADCEKCTKCSKTRNEGHVWAGCKCKVCMAKRIKGRTYVEGERGWDGCTGHDWSGGYIRCTKCSVSGYDVCTEAIGRTRSKEPWKYVDAEDESDLRANPRFYLDIVKSFLEMGMDPRQNYFTDPAGYYGHDYDPSKDFFRGAGRGEGGLNDRPLMHAIAYDCIEVIELMKSFNIPLDGSCGGVSLAKHAQDHRSNEVLQYLSRGVRRSGHM